MTEKLVKCPVCKKEFWNTGLRNHILNRAVAEVYRNYIGKVKSIPHQKYIEKNNNYIKIRKLKI